MITNNAHFSYDLLVLHVPFMYLTINQSSKITQLSLYVRTFSLYLSTFYLYVWHFRFIYKSVSFKNLCIVGKIELSKHVSWKKHFVTNHLAYHAKTKPQSTINPIHTTIHMKYVHRFFFITCRTIYSSPEGIYANPTLLGNKKIITTMCVHKEYGGVFNDETVKINFLNKVDSNKYKILWKCR